jgi:hypothetical protein
MPRTRSGIDNIREELAWVTEPVDHTTAGISVTQTAPRPLNHSRNQFTRVFPKAIPRAFGREALSSRHLQRS